MGKQRKQLVADLRNLRDRYAYKRGINEAASKEEDIRLGARFQYQSEAVAWSEALELLDELISDWDND